MLLAIFLVLIAVIILYFGAEFSLEGSEVVGIKLGLSPLAIGMLLIGLGTSLPELFVGHIAGLQGKHLMAVGGLVGSNLANMFLILGCSALVTPLMVQHKGVKDQLWVHLLLGIVVSLVLYRGKIDLISMAALFALGVPYFWLLFKDIKSEVVESGPSNAISLKQIRIALFKMIVGFSMLYIGGELLVKGGTLLGAAFEVSEYVISVILLAFGTSFPELVTSLMTAFKKKDTDLIVGNILGSNLFNCSFILGSLGPYHFDLNGHYTWEIAGLIGGALFMLIAGHFRKQYSWISSIFFLGSYAVLVYHWI